MREQGGLKPCVNGFRYITDRLNWQGLCNSNALIAWYTNSTASLPVPRITSLGFAVQQTLVRGLVGLTIQRLQQTGLTGIGAEQGGICAANVEQIKGVGAVCSSVINSKIASIR